MKLNPVWQSVNEPIDRAVKKSYLKKEQRDLNKGAQKQMNEIKTLEGEEVDSAVIEIARSRLQSLVTSTRTTSKFIKNCMC